MLIAAWGKYGDDSNVIKRLKDDDNKEKKKYMVAALFGDKFLYSSGLMEKDGLDEGDKYVDLDGDRPHEVDEKLAMQVEEATKNGMSKERVKMLRNILEK